MKILALDISTKCTGWAHLHSVEGTKKWAHGQIISPKYFAGLTKNELLMGQALYWFCKEVKRLCDKYKPDYLVAEDINIRHVTTMRSLAQFHAAASIGASIFKKELVLQKVHNSTIRSELSIPGKNHAPAEVIKTAKLVRVDPSKVMMVDTINKKFETDLGYDQHDEADSMAIAWTFLVRRL